MAHQEFGTFTPIDKSSHVTTEAVEVDLQHLLLNEPTSRQAQDFLKTCWTNGQWLSCPCADDAFLTIRKTNPYYVLVRLTSRGQHADDCSLSEKNMPIYRSKLAQKIGTHSLSFHRAPPSKKSRTPAKSPISVQGLNAEASVLARFMFTLYDEAGLNCVPLSGERPDLKTQYGLIRETAAKYYIAGQSGSNIIFSHPGQIENARNYLIEHKWPENALPHVLLFFTVDQITERNIRLSVGKQEYTLESKSRIEYFWDNASPPFNCLMTLALRPDSPKPEILRCSALPIFNKSWLLPVKNNLVRKFIQSLLAMSKDYETYDAKIVLPFFPKLFSEINIRPDFSIERQGSVLAVFYFISTQDIDYDARVGEINFLKSHDIEVFTFDMDKVRTDAERDAWKAAKSFFDRYIKRFKLTEKQILKDAAPKDDLPKPINLLA